MTLKSVLLFLVAPEDSSGAIFHARPAVPVFLGRTGFLFLPVLVAIALRCPSAGHDRWRGRAC